MNQNMYFSKLFYQIPKLACPIQNVSDCSHQAEDSTDGLEPDAGGVGATENAPDVVLVEVQQEVVDKPQAPAGDIGGVAAGLMALKFRKTNFVLKKV